MSCRHLQRVDLLEGSAGRRQDGDEDGLAFFADLIALGVLDFSDEPVSLQQSEFSADGGQLAAALGIRGRWGTVQQPLQI